MYIGSPTQTAGAATTQGVNLKQVNGSTISLGQTTMLNSLPVVIASDQTAIPVSGTFWQATQPVSGTVTANQGTAAALSSGWPVKVTDGTNTMPTMDVVGRAGLITLTDGTNKQTFMSTTTTSKFGADINILSILGTAPTTVGKLDVKGADGDIFVRQATASNLNATVVGTGTFAVQAALNAETTKVIGTVRALGNAGAIFDQATGSAVPANAIQIGISDGTNLRAPTANSTTYTSKYGMDVNILGTLGTAFSAAGKVDVKGADGDVFVRQATASNLKMDLSGSAANSTAGLFSAKIDQTTLGSTNAVTPVPASNSGWSFSYQSALTNSATQIKGSAGTFGGYLWLYNPNTAVTYIQVFNKASASVTLGVTAPDYVIALPGIASASATGSAANMEMVHGIAMGTGITVAATTTASGSTAPSNAVVATFLYK